MLQGILINRVSWPRVNSKVSCQQSGVGNFFQHSPELEEKDKKRGKNWNRPGAEIKRENSKHGEGRKYKECKLGWCGWSGKCEIRDHPNHSVAHKASWDFWWMDKT